MKILRPILVICLFSLGLSACSHTPLSQTQSLCQSTDWFEKGRQDGASGNLPQTSTHQNRCNEYFNEDSQALYLNGFNGGLTEYCSPENAFQIGQMGGSAENQCPLLMKDAFKVGFEKGVESRKLKAKNQELASQIENLSQKQISRSISSIEKGSISSELEQLKRQYAQNQKKISQAAQSTAVNN
jgi:hypothetical protein